MQKKDADRSEKEREDVMQMQNNSNEKEQKLTSKQRPSFLLGKLEKLKYPDFWQETNDEEKKELELFFKVFSGCFLSIFILTNILPEKTLDLVKFMSLVFPTIAAFEKLSEFPQIGQIVYSFCIITMPLQYLFIHRISIKVWERLLKAHTKNDIIIALCIIIPIYIIFAADILYFFTTTKQTSVFTKCFHTSKICYSLITATVFFVLAMVLSLIIFCAKKIKNQGG